MPTTRTYNVTAAQTTPPGSPTAGAMYLVTATATGAWVGKENKIAYYSPLTSGWAFISLNVGTAVFVESNSYTYTWDGSNFLITKKPEASTAGTRDVPNVPAQVTYHYSGTATTASGGRTVGLVGTTANAARAKTPSDKCFKVLGVTASVTSGATNGTYTIDIIVRDETGATDYVLGTATIVVSGGAAVTSFVSAFGTVDSPLATIAINSEFRVGWLHRSGPAALSGDQKLVFVTGVFV